MEALSSESDALCTSHALEGLELLSVLLILVLVSVDNVHIGECSRYVDAGECRYMVSVSVADKQQTAELQTRKCPLWPSTEHPPATRQPTVQCCALLPDNEGSGAAAVLTMNCCTDTDPALVPDITTQQRQGPGPGRRHGRGQPQHHRGGDGAARGLRFR